VKRETIDDSILLDHKLPSRFRIVTRTYVADYTGLKLGVSGN
jgi:hypothetical protein